MKKFIALALVAVTLSMLLISCNKGQNSSETGTDSQQASSETETEAESTVSLITEEGESEYLIIYPDSYNLLSDATALKSKIYSAYSVNIWPKKDTQVDVGTYEILIGNTNRAESATLLSSLADDEYGIKMINGKIVINSSSEDGIKAAIKEFSSMYVNESNKNLTVPANLDIKNKVPSEYESLEAGWNFKSFAASNSVNLPYQIYVPASFEEGKEYPVILFMHGMGSVGTSGEHITQTVAQFVKNVAASEKYKNECIIIAPQLPKGQKWVNVQVSNGQYPGTYDFDNMPISSYLKAAKDLFDYAFENLPVDTDRVYGYGNSMGAYATVYLAMTYPDLYAAIVPVAGGMDPTKAELIKDIPAWFFHGTADKTVPNTGTKAMYANLQSLGATNIKLTEFPGIGHAAQGCFVAAANTNGLLDWMFAQKKS